jgi:1-acyl-sn-glycerol-3-phosphate acyltransferase
MSAPTDLRASLRRGAVAWTGIGAFAGAALAPAALRDGPAVALAAAMGLLAGVALTVRASRLRLELGLVPVGALTATLGFLAQALAPAAWPPALGWGFGLAAAAGPLRAWLAWRAPADRADLRAADAAAAFAAGVGAAVGLALDAAWGPAPRAALLAVGLGAGAAWALTVLPDFLLRLAAGALAHVAYRVEVVGAERVPVDGPCLIVANHVSFVDWLVLAAAVRRPPRFVMDRDIANWPVARWLFRAARAIPIAGRKADPALVARAFDLIHDELAEGGVVGIFPEGRLTPDGQIGPFRRGVEDILARDPVPVVPIALDGLWGSTFSREAGKALSRLPRRLRSPVRIVIGHPLDPTGLTADALRDAVAALLDGSG